MVVGPSYKVLGRRGRGGRREYHLCDGAASNSECVERVCPAAMFAFHPYSEMSLTMPKISKILLLVASVVLVLTVFLGVNASGVSAASDDAGWRVSADQCVQRGAAAHPDGLCGGPEYSVR